MSNAALYVKPSPGWWSSGIPPRIAIHSSGGGTRCGCGGPCRSRSTRSCATGAEKSEGKPCPFVDVNRCRSVIGRLAGTVSSTGPVIERTTTGARQLRQQLTDRLVEPQGAVGDERQCQRRDHRLGDRGDAEQRVLHHRPSVHRNVAEHDDVHLVAPPDGGDQPRDQLRVHQRAQRLGESGHRTSLAQLPQDPSADSNAASSATSDDRLPRQAPGLTRPKSAILCR